MPKRFRNDFPEGDITPPEIFFNRRQVVAGLGAAIAAPSMLLSVEPGDKLRLEMTSPGIASSTSTCSFS